MFTHARSRSFQFINMTTKLYKDALVSSLSISICFTLICLVTHVEAYAHSLNIEPKSNADGSFHPRLERRMDGNTKAGLIGGICGFVVICIMIYWSCIRNR